MRYTEDFKIQTVARYRNGELGTRLCKELGIARSTLRRWSIMYGEAVPEGKEPFIRIDTEKLLKQVERQAQIIEILKTVDCTVHSPLKIRLLALEELYGQYKVSVLCEALDVDRGTFYNHINRNKRNEAWFAKRREEYTVCRVSELPGLHDPIQSKRNLRPE